MMRVRHCPSPNMGLDLSQGRAMQTLPIAQPRRSAAQQTWIRGIAGTGCCSSFSPREEVPGRADEGTRVPETPLRSYPHPNHLPRGEGERAGHADQQVTLCLMRASLSRDAPAETCQKASRLKLALTKSVCHVEHDAALVLIPAGGTRMAMCRHISVACTAIMPSPRTPPTLRLRSPEKGLSEEAYLEHFSCS